MKALSDFFNLLNNKERKAKNRAAFFDLTQPKGRWLFTGAIILVAAIYLISLALSEKFYFSTVAFIIDIYLFLIPLWFIIRIEHWEYDLLRKILFYYQFSKQDELDDLEFITTPGVELQQIVDADLTEKVMIPINVRFMIDFKPNPKNFHSLSIQIILNEYMGNKFPFFVCFLRINNPNDWMPLKKDVAYADNLTKIEHTIEEDNLHLFTLSKSPKATEPNHTSPHEAAKIFRRAQKMLFDFTKED